MQSYICWVFFQLYSKGSLFTKHYRLTTLPELTVSGSFCALLFNFSTFLLFKVSEISRSHWTTKSTLYMLTAYMLTSSWSISASPVMTMRFSILVSETPPFTICRWQKKEESILVVIPYCHKALLSVALKQINFCD